MNTERHIIEWLISTPCVVFWLFCVVANPILFVRREIMKCPGTPSLIPVIGGIAGGIGILHIPIAHVSQWYWTAILLDFGAVPWLAYVFGKAGFERLRMKR